MATKNVNLQELADCFFAAEVGLAQAVVDIAETLRCVDRAARDANKAGLRIRACDLGEYDRRLGDITAAVARELSHLKDVHRDLCRVAEGLDLPLPTPRGGGR